MQFENFLRFQILDEHNASLICLRECNPLYVLYLLLLYKSIVQPCIMSISPLQGSWNEYVFLHCYKYMRLYRILYFAKIQIKYQLLVYLLEKTSYKPKI